MTRTILAAAGLLTADLAAAHEGHGAANPHWHASDLFGLLLAVAAVAGWWWWRSRR